MNKNIISLIQRLWTSIEKERKKSLLKILFLMIFTSFFDVISIGAILPFLSVLTNPDILKNNEVFQYLEKLFSLQISNVTLAVTFLFCLSAVIAGLMRLLLLRRITKISYDIGMDFDIKIYNNAIYQPYCVHLLKNSNELINAISRQTTDAISIVLACLNFVAAGIIFFVIMSSLIILSSSVTIYVFLMIGGVYFFIIKVTKVTMEKNSAVISRDSALLIKYLQEGMGGIRDIILDGVQNLFSSMYSRADIDLRKAQALNQFIGGAPRYLIEIIGMLVVAILGYYVTQDNLELGSAIPILGLLAFSAQRLMPILQQLYGSWTGIIGGQNSLNDVLQMLENMPSLSSNLESSKIKFEQSIVLKSVSYRYLSSNSFVLKDIQMTINKGDRIGIVGRSGAGKTTLIDLILGLLNPSNGDMYVDGIRITQNNSRNWQKNVAHVPQSIYLTDSTIAENIAFGVAKENINFNRINFVIKMAELSELVENLPSGYETKVGERGVRLSGGQRQRIGIARALYKDSDVIVLDEATSALDDITESRVMDNIENYSKKRTLIIVAHRYTTLKKCAKIYKINDGLLLNVATSESLMGLEDKSTSF